MTNLCDTCDNECPANPNNFLAGSCLPTLVELVYLQEKHNITWACHSDESKPCIGLLTAMRDRNKPVKVNELYTFTRFNTTGFKDIDKNFYENVDEYLASGEYAKGRHYYD